MPILGNNTQGDTLVGTNTNIKRHTKYSLAAAATLIELRAFLIGGTANTSFVLSIYADSAGAPSTRLAYTSPFLVLASAPIAEYGQSGFSVSLPAGDYWIGWGSNGALGSAKYTDDPPTIYTGSAGSDFNPPADPYGTNTPSTGRKHTVWAVLSVPSGGTGGGGVPRSFLGTNDARQPRESDMSQGISAGLVHPKVPKYAPINPRRGVE